MKKIIALVGKSGTGKDMIAKEINKVLNIPIALSFTTRPMRKGEKQGVEYEFITDTDFKMKLQNNEIAERTSYNVATDETWYYGLSKNQLEKDDYVLAIINVNGLKQIEGKYGNSVVSILIETDDKTRLKRALDREENPNVTEICRRLLADKVDFENANCDYVVYNNSSPIAAIQEVKNIITSEMEI